MKDVGEKDVGEKDVGENDRYQEPGNVLGIDNYAIPNE